MKKKSIIGMTEHSVEEEGTVYIYRRRKRNFEGQNGQTNPWHHYRSSFGPFVSHA